MESGKHIQHHEHGHHHSGDVEALGGDRKSTRLNSSHALISYAVFCLKKKNKQKTHKPTFQ